ncbi:hypothetical protein ACU4GD_24980 [Cupriavidus basilensis]
MSKRILQDVMAPHFRQNDFYGGIAAGVSAIQATIDKEPCRRPQAGGKAGPERLVDRLAAGAVPACIILFFFIAAAWRSGGSRIVTRGRGGTRRPADWAAPLAVSGVAAGDVAAAVDSEAVVVAAAALVVAAVVVSVAVAPPATGNGICPISNAHCATWARAPAPPAGAFPAGKPRQRLQQAVRAGERQHRGRSAGGNRIQPARGAGLLEHRPARAAAHLFGRWRCGTPKAIPACWLLYQPGRSRGRTAGRPRHRPVWARKPGARSATNWQAGWRGSCPVR